MFKMKRACDELILIFTTFVPLFSIWFLQGMLGREASLWAECSHSMRFFFFTPRFCQASLIRGLSLAGHCCSEALFMPSSSLILPPSLPLCLFLPALHFQRITMALRRGRTFAAHRTDTSCRTTWRRAQSGKRVSLRGLGWGTARGCRTPTMAILRDGHASSFE